jgi:prepilin-type N-terminal cleavage/methylation domain-containing protein
MKRAIRSKGFTLLEIMVSLTVGGIALGSIYAVGSASTRFFRDQQRISASQTSLRAAMATLKRDFQRAGFLSSPNTRYVGESCVEPLTVDSRWIGAVNGYVKNAPKPTRLDPDNLNSRAAEFFTVDQVWLTGNFATSGEYPNINVSPDGFVVSVPMGWQSFQRDFSNWTGANAANCDATAFQAAFPEDRLVRLHAQNGTFFYARVASTTCAGDTTGTATITLKDSVPTTCNMNGGWIAPVNTYFYRVVNAETSEDDAQRRVTVLRRSEVMAENRNNLLTAQVGAERVNVEDRALLDYVVKFNVSFLGWFPGTGGVNRVSYVPMTQVEVVTNPHFVRGVILDVAVRTPQQEPDFTADVPTAAFKIWAGTNTGAARVRRMRAEMLMPNLANRNLDRAL